jgi:hypothetical protein
MIKVAKYFEADGYANPFVQSRADWLLQGLPLLYSAERIASTGVRPHFVYTNYKLNAWARSNPCSSIDDLADMRRTFALEWSLMAETDRSVALSQISRTPASIDKSMRDLTPNAADPDPSLRPRDVEEGTWRLHDGARVPKTMLVEVGHPSGSGLA